jgi:arylsulfatase A-like enzyme
VRTLSRIGLLSVAAFALWGFWPVDNAGLEIHFDAEQVRATQAFLAERTAGGGGGKPPNVVLIVADDLGKHDISVYGPSPTPTPNIAQLAAEGVTFTEGYVTSPVCSPSRAALMTGRYAQRFGFETLVHERYPRNRFEWWFMHGFLTGHGWYGSDQLRVPRYEDRERQGIPPSEILISELLSKQGYSTAITGKWHLGFGPDLLPQKRGFDYQYGFYDAFSLYGDPHDPDMVGVRDDYFADRYQWWRGRSGGSAILRNGIVIEEDGYLTDKIADEAVRWITEHRDGPFFAYVPFSAPHAPIQAPRDYVDRFADVADPRQRVYFGMIAALDDAIGKILRALEANGIAEDTLVVFLSDNGAANYTGIIDNAPLKGGKLTNFEGGVNVPFLMRWPGHLPATTTYTRPVSSLDVFMTIAQATGSRLPPDRTYDGVDLVPYVRGAIQNDPHDALFWRAHGHRGIRAGRYKLLSDSLTGARALYDLETDPYEKNDLLSKRPELGAALEQQLQRWETSLMSPRWPNVMEYHFSDGGRRFVFPL